MPSRRRLWLGTFACSILLGGCTLLGLWAGAAHGQEGSDEVLIVGGDFDLPPFEYLDEAGRPRGYNVALAEAIGQVMDVAVEVRLSPWNEAREALRTGEVDALMGVAYTDERAALYDFSAPHETLDNAIFVRKGEDRVSSANDLPHAEIIAVRGDVNWEWARAQGLGDNLVTVASQADALRLLASGEHDCALLTRLPGLYLIRHLTLSNLTMTGAAFQPAPYCAAVRKGDTELLGRISEALTVLQQTGAYDRIRDEWLGMYETDKQARERILRILQFVIAGAAALLIVALLWTWLLRRQVAHRTDALRAEIEERKRVAEALAESEHRFRQVSENINDVFWLAEVDNGPQMRYLSPAFERIYGRAREELLENPLCWFDWVHPDDREALRQFYRSLAPSAASHENVFRIVRPDGAVRWLHDRTVVMPSDEMKALRIAGVSQDITEQVLATETLAHNEARLRSITQHAPVEIFEIDRQGTVVYANFDFDDMLGRPPVGEHILKWLPEQERAAADRALERVFSERSPQSFEYTLTDREGAQYTFLVRAAPIEHGGDDSGAVVIAYDITKRTQAETALAAREAQYRSLVENIEDVILRIDLEGHLTYVSPASQRVLDMPPGAMVGKRLCDIPFFQHQAGACRGAFQRIVESGQGETLEFEVLTAARSLVSSWRFFPERDAESHVVGVMCTLRDVTAQRTLEQRLLQEQKLDSLGTLAGGVAHDFNNIMMIIAGNTEMLLEDLPPDSPSRAMLAEIDRGARRAAELAHQMLAYSGRSTVRRESIDLNAFITNATPLLRATLPAPTALVNELSDGEARIQGDTNQLRQLLLNVIANAGEALENGRGTVCIRTEVRRYTGEELRSPFIVDHAAPGRYVCIEVADNGHGIERAGYMRLFDPFYTTKFTGRGLGLAAVLGIVRMHHGVVQVDATPGKGAVFRFLFPYAGDAPAEETDDDPVRILVVDDEDAIRTLAEEVLRDAGYAVDTASSGKEALKRLEAGQSYKGVLLDYSMPDMDGKAVLTHIAKAHPNLAVILSSGFPEEVVRAETDHLPFSAFLKKPYRRAALTEAISRCTGHSSGGGPSGDAGEASK